MFDGTIAYLLEHPWIFLVQAVLALCLATGVWSRSRTFRPANKHLGTRSIPHTAHWIPWIGNAFARWLSSSTLLDKKARDCQSPVFATTMYGREYIVLTDANSLEDLLRGGKVKPNWPDSDAISRRFFGNSNITAAKISRKQQMKQIYRDDEGKLDAVATLLGTHAYNLISPAQSWVDQAQWERTSGVKVIDTEPMLVVSASFNILIRDFSAYILLCPLLGRSFLEANPDFIPDMFRFGSSYNSFMRGLPYWIMPGLGPPAFAREKCLRALDGLVRAITAEQTGQSVIGLGDAVLYDVDEVHQSILYAVRHAREDSEKPGIRTASTEILEFLFELTHYYVYEILWVLIYSMKSKEQCVDVMDIIRKEIKQVVKVIKPPPSGLPFEDPPQLLFGKFHRDDFELRAECPRLASIVDRVVKQEAEPLREFEVIADNNVNVGQRIEGKSNVRFALKQGDRVLSGFRYTAPGSIEALVGRKKKDELGITDTQRVWIVLTVLISLYDFELLNNSVPPKLSGSNSGFSSITESRRDLQVKICRQSLI